LLINFEGNVSLAVRATSSGRAEILVCQSRV
jgi:hypothetical protein